MFHSHLSIRLTRSCALLWFCRGSGSARTSGAIVLMMVTSAERSHWETDIELDDWQRAGLRKSSILRWKIFTLDEQLIVSRRGYPD
jgi:hypothetical protein